MADIGRTVTRAKYRKIDPRELVWETEQEVKLAPEVMIYMSTGLYHMSTCISLCVIVRVWQRKTSTLYMCM